MYILNIYIYMWYWNMLDMMCALCMKHSEPPICPVLSVSAGACFFDFPSRGRMFRVPPGAFLRAGWHQGGMISKCSNLDQESMGFMGYLWNLMESYGYLNFLNNCNDDFITTCLLSLLASLEAWTWGFFHRQIRVWKEGLIGLYILFVVTACQSLRHLSEVNLKRWIQHRQETR